MYKLPSIYRNKQAFLNKSFLWLWKCEMLSWASRHTFFKLSAVCRSNVCHPWRCRRWWPLTRLSGVAVLKTAIHDQAVLLNFFLRLCLFFFTSFSVFFLSMCIFPLSLSFFVFIYFCLCVVLFHFCFRCRTLCLRFICGCLLRFA
jgi:hypothetical protein